MPSRTENCGATQGKGATQDKGLYTIEPVPGKGLGVIATQDMPRGTRIMADAPLFVVPTSVTNVEVMKQIIAAGLKTAPKERQREFLTLPNAHPAHGPLVGTASTNVHPMGGGAATEAGMFLTACRINHACDNNAQNAWNASRRRMTVHACRDIRKGDEVSLTYLRRLLPRAERQATLRQNFGFECRCGRCAEPDAESDRRREEIHRLDDSLGDGRRIVEHPADALHDARAKLRLLAEEGISDASVARTYHDAFQIAVANGDLARARVFAERDYRETVVCEGDDSAGAAESRRLVDRPESHSLYSKKGQWRQGVDQIPKGLDEDAFERWLWRM